MLKLALWPDSILKKEAKRVEVFDQKLKFLSEEMFKFMKQNKGIGLAAPQVSIDKKMLVMDVNRPIVMINPRIYETSKYEVEKGEEGCLSFPGFLVEVERFKKIDIEYNDLDGNVCSLKLEDLEARCVQHELDHLNGVTFLKYLSKLHRDMITAKMKKMQRRV